MKCFNLKVPMYLFLLFLFSLYSLSPAKRMSDHGEGSGNGREIGPYSSVATTGGGYVNQITGLPVYSTKIAQIASNSGFSQSLNLTYGFGTMNTVTQYNRYEPTEWVGLGWHLGTSYFYCIPIDTNYNMRYYYVENTGSVSEVVRTDDGRWRIKSDPYWYVEEKERLNNAITKWKITKPDGTIFNYNATRFTTRLYYDSLKCANSKGQYPYRVDLSSSRDVNGSGFDYQYSITNITFSNWCGTVNPAYTQEAYLREISANDNGDKLIFTVEDKDPYEYFADPDTTKARIYEKKFLRNIKYVDRSNRLIDSIVLIYSGDTNRVQHLWNGVADREKRQLISIISTKSTGAINRVFEYEANNDLLGLLKRITEVQPGRSILFSYETKFFRVIEGVQQAEYLFPAVVKTTIYDAFRLTPVQITNYTYSDEPFNVMYIPSTGMGYFGIVKANSGTGDIVSTYAINPESPMFGNAGNIITYNTNGKTVATQESNVDVQPFISGTDTFYYTVMVNNQQTTNGVRNVTGFLLSSLNNVNGTASITYKALNDTVGLATETKFAFEYYPAMGYGTGRTGQVSQAAGTKVMRYGDDGIDDTIGGEIYDDMLNNSTVISASFTTWKRWESTQLYRPYKTYVWSAEEPFYPESSFTEFDTAAPSANGWKNTATITQYNQFGSVVEAADANNTYSTTIYRNDYNLPVASILNAKSNECAVLTGDYGFDNGWEKQGSVVQNSITHFGENALRINNANGPRNTRKIYQSKDYLFSAWVHVTSGTLIMDGYYRKSASGTEQIPFSIPNVEIKPAAGWQKIEMRIPASKDIKSADWGTYDWHATFLLTAQSGNAYIDDIRFYPVGAQVTTNYYNAKWRTVRLGVDANNNPGNFTELDSLGRAKAVYQINKTKSYQDSGWKTPLVSKQYHTAGDELYVITPNGDEELIAKSRYAITWNQGSGALMNDSVTIRFYNGSSWSTIAQGVKGQNSYLWSVPDNVFLNCKIAVISSNFPNQSDTTDSEFSIVKNRCPGQPRIVSPYFRQNVSDDTVRLRWNKIIDADSDAVSFRVEIRHTLDTTWWVLANSYIDTQYCFVPADWPYGRYIWRVQASDGKCVSSKENEFYLVPSGFFAIRDIKERIVFRLPDSLYSSIHATLTSEKKILMESTYDDTTEESGFHYINSSFRGYFATDDTLENCFYYSVLHSKGKDRWLTAFEGRGAGHTGLRGGGGCGRLDGKMQAIKICPYKMGGVPELKLEYNWACPNTGVKTITWDQVKLTKNVDNAIMQIKMDIQKTHFGNPTHLHIWYKAWHRGAMDSGWKTDFQPTGPGDRKVDKVWIHIFKYDSGNDPL